MVEVELDLVGGRTDRLITSELKLLNQVLVGLLCHSTALIGIKEHVVDVQRSGNKGLLVGTADLSANSSRSRSHAGASPEALINGAEIKVDLDLVVIEEQ